jgi:probable F420-dependent oxidoreductase
MSGFRLGAVYPQTELGGDPRALELIGRRVEALGFDYLLMYDHVVGAEHTDRDPPLWNLGPYTDRHPFHEPLIAFAYLAGITRTLCFATGVMILPQRQTVLVAKQAADVALLSGDRLRLGVGTGWNHVEYAALGQRFEERGARLSEQIGYLRQLWQEPLLSFTGRFDRIERASILPRPARAIPIWCGGFTEPAFRRAAAMADGFIFAGPLEGALAGWRRLQDLLREAGREPAAFGAEYMLQDASGGGLSVAGGLDALQRWRDAGGSHAAVVTMGRGYRDPDEHLAHLDGCRAGLGLSP